MKKNVPLPQITLEEMKAMYPNSPQMFEERKPAAPQMRGFTLEQVKAMYPKSPEMWNLDRWG